VGVVKAFRLVFRNLDLGEPFYHPAANVTRQYHPNGIPALSCQNKNDCLPPPSTATRRVAREGLFAHDQEEVAVCSFRRQASCRCAHPGQPPKECSFLGPQKEMRHRFKKGMSSRKAKPTIEALGELVCCFKVDVTRSWLDSTLLENPTQRGALPEGRPKRSWPPIEPFGAADGVELLPPVAIAYHRHRNLHRGESSKLLHAERLRLLHLGQPSEWAQLWQLA